MNENTYETPDMHSRCPVLWNELLGRFLCRDITKGQLNQLEFTSIDACVLPFLTLYIYYNSLFVRTLHVHNVHDKDRYTSRSIPTRSSGKANKSV